VIANLLPPPVFVSPPVFVAPPPVVVVESPPVIVTQPPTIITQSPPQPQPQAAAGNTTALQITELGRGGAARAGLQVGDVILSVDDVRTTTFEELRVALSRSNGMSQFVFFNPDTQTLDNKQVAVANGLIGATVLEVPITLDETPNQNALPAGSQMAMQITALDRGGAGRAGILVGDIILGVDSKWVTSQAELDAALKASKGESDVVVYNADSGKAETRKVAVANGTIGVTVQPVVIQLQN